MENIKCFDKYSFGLISGQPEYDFCDKKKCINQHITYMLNRTQSMFEYKNLPDSIPKRSLELFLQINGSVGFYEYNNNLYVFTGGLGGMPNPYYMPTIFTISNPALNISKNLKIDEECIIVPNDSMYTGLMPMFSRYATALTENEISMRIATINSRIIDFITAPDDSSKASAEKFLKDVIDGKLGVIADNAFLEGIKVQPYGSKSNNIIINLIELEQYIKASWFNELGLNANYNMKRESLNSAESQLNNDSLLPLVDDMLNCRKIGIEKVNQKFGTDIIVSLSSSWEDNIEEIEIEHDIINGGDGNEVQTTE